MSLRISPTLELPLEAVTQTFGILAKRGVGKTYTASVMTEEMLKNNLPVVVIDPIGVWWGLRSAANGKGPGLKIIIAGGEHADVPIEETSGEILANLVVDQRVSIVIDLSLFRKGQQTRFMQDFAETLYHRNRTALHVVVDEADAYAPQRAMPGQQRLLGAMEDLVRRGRARGIGVTLITQRPAVLNKDVLTQVEVLVTLRMIAPQDRKAIEEWVKVHGDPEQSRKLMDSLPSLPIGTAWFWSPGWLDIFQKVKVRKRETLDSSSTPKVGQQAAAGKMAEVNIDLLREQLATTIEKVQSEDPKLLQRRIFELEKIKADQHQQIQDLLAEEPETKIVEKPIVTEEDLTKFKDLLEPVTDFLRELAGRLPKTDQMAPPLSKVYNSPPPAYTMPKPQPVAKKPVDPDTNVGLSKAERSILSVLAQYPQGRTTTQVALLTGYAVNGGGFRNALGALRSKGLIDGRANLQITEEGHDAIGDDFEPLPVGKALIEYWQGRLGRAAAMILGVATELYPAEVPIEEVAERTGYASGGGGFRNALGKLRTLELIEGRSAIRASDALFMVKVR
jgi:hypothetical protein